MKFNQHGREANFTAPINQTVSVVVPVYRSETTIGELIRRLFPVLNENFVDFELILVDDGSMDGGWNVIQEQAAQHSWVRGLRLMRNFGQHNALLCGIREARHAVIVTMDDDLQYPPEKIPEMVEKMMDGFDVVYGSASERRHGFMRILMTRFTKFILKTVMRLPRTYEVSPLRAFSAELRGAFANHQGSFVSIDVLLSWATSRFTCIRVNRNWRHDGQSRYTVAKLFTYTVNVITGFTVLPLRFASLVGFFFTLFGLGVLTYVLGRFLLEGVGVPGFAFLASIIAIFSGAQLFALGIIGEYLARIHFHSMGKPTYVVAEDTSNPHETAKEEASFHSELKQV
ncbi:MAG: glycosyltransferase family 2 protein [Opitutales bacterium]|nr:glycosyltransferase family 2 protein [Opitutales bacterium]MCH8539775.1 glycosyltransferase family 2 protein [Opitutales bacterium]